VVFKKLIYEMRFDEASAAYALVRIVFYIGLQFRHGPGIVVERNHAHITPVT